MLSQPGISSTFRILIHQLDRGLRSAFQAAGERFNSDVVHSPSRVPTVTSSTPPDILIEALPDLLSTAALVWSCRGHSCLNGIRSAKRGTAPNSRDHMVSTGMSLALAEEIVTPLKLLRTDVILNALERAGKKYCHLLYFCSKMSRLHVLSSFAEIYSHLDTRTLLTSDDAIRALDLLTALRSLESQKFALRDGAGAGEVEAHSGGVRRAGERSAWEGLLRQSQPEPVIPATDEARSARISRASGRVADGLANDYTRVMLKRDDTREAFEAVCEEANPRFSSVVQAVASHHSTLTVLPTFEQFDGELGRILAGARIEAGLISEFRARIRSRVCHLSEDPETVLMIGVKRIRLDS